MCVGRILKEETCTDEIEANDELELGQTILEEGAKFQSIFDSTSDFQNEPHQSSKPHPALQYLLLRITLVSISFIVQSFYGLTDDLGLEANSSGSCGTFFESAVDPKHYEQSQ